MKLLITEHIWEPFTGGPNTYEMEEYDSNKEYNCVASVVEVEDVLGSSILCVYNSLKYFNNLMEFLFENGTRI